MSVVLDTNVIVAGLRSRDGASFQILNAVIERHIGFVLSVPLVLEYEDVLKRPSTLLASGLSISDMDQILNILCERGTAVELHYLWRPQLRDDKDEMVLELAVNAAAEAIVTFNRSDFLPAADLFAIPVITPSEFYKSIKESKA